MNQDPLAAPVRLLSATTAPAGAGDLGAGGSKLTMAACDAADLSQSFSRSGDTLVAHDGRCVTVLSDRWPWWVSLLPCDATDQRQSWTLVPGSRGSTSNHTTGDNGVQIHASKKAASNPWPGPKCFTGKCKAQGCLEVEGANPEVDQCGWSTNSSQFLWEWTTGSAKNSGLRNHMSGQCLTSGSDLQVFGGPLAGGKYTAVLFNRSPSSTNITLDLDTLGIPPSTPMSFRDIVAHEDLGMFRGTFATRVRSHAVVHVVLSTSS